MLPFRNRRVLLVEGDAFMAGTIMQMLQDLGAIVVGPAINRDIALDMAQTGSFDVAVIDLILDGQRGFEIAEAIQHRGLPFVLTNAIDRAIDPQSLRYSPRIMKPFSAHELTATLMVALKQKGYSI